MRKDKKEYTFLIKEMLNQDAGFQKVTDKDLENILYKSFIIDEKEKTLITGKNEGIYKKVFKSEKGNSVLVSLVEVF